MEVEETIKSTIYKYISPDEYKVFLFGSRAVGNNSKWSDFDIGIIGKEVLPYSKLEMIESELEDSNIPYRVEIVDFARVSDKFKKIALGKVIQWTRN